MVLKCLLLLSCLWSCPVDSFHGIYTSRFTRYQLSVQGGGCGPPIGPPRRPGPRAGSGIHTLRSVPAPLDGSGRYSLATGLKDLLPGVLLGLLIRRFCLSASIVISHSMFPTLHSGDCLLIEKLSKHFRRIRHGDIVIFSPTKAISQICERNPNPTASADLVKRVVGVYGDVVTVTNGQLYVNNILQIEPYVLQLANYAMQPVRVPRGMLLVLGDHRCDSMDSHLWGLLPVENVIGRAVCRYWPLDRVGWIA